MRLLRAAGHEITHDWTGEHASTDEEWLECALRDLEGVWDADVLVIEVRPEMRGAWTEFGVAIARLIPVVVVGGDHACIFEWLPRISHVDTREQAVAVVSGLAAQRPN